MIARKPQLTLLAAAATVSLDAALAPAPASAYSGRWGYWRRHAWG